MKPLVCCLISSIVLILISCINKADKSEGKLFKPDNILTQQFSIDPAKDTTLIGRRGGIFRISKGSFTGDSRINIEIKEVYSPLEIVYAGLVTESKGRLLESGGMIYFNAFDKGNKQAALLRPVNVSIPSNYINENMQLFKGDEYPDGGIDWVDPQPLSPSSNTPCLDRGKAIFEGRCKSCHAIFTDRTGPALAGVEERVKDRSVIKEYIRFPAKVMYSNSYFMCLKNKFGSTMTAFPMLTDQDIDCLLDYVKNETAKRPDLKAGLSSGPVIPCIDAPCGFDTIITSFSVTHKQTVFLKIKEGSKEQLNKAFREMKLDGVDLDIITKKRIISPNPCTGVTDSTLNTTFSL